MATSVLDHAPAVHAEKTGIWSWITTVDHKRIGILYGTTAFLFFLMGLQILGIGSMAAALNFFVTIVNLRAPGMKMLRMPMFVWMSFITQMLLLLAFPVITVALVFLMMDRHFGSHFFLPEGGGDP